MKLSFSSVSLALFLWQLSCSASPLTLKEVKAKAALGFHLIELAEGAEPVWKSEQETDELVAQGVRFFDVTDVYEPPTSNRITTAAAKANAVYTYAAPSHQAELKPILNLVSLSTMQSYLSSLTAFNNRYYKSTTGQQASVWIRDTVAAIISQYPASGASVALYTHSWVQSSIVAKIPGKTSGPVTILGGHMDSVGTGTVTTSRAPGADDDGSGSVNLLEAFRVLVTSGFKPTTPVEFHWYSAEEGGLRGSQDIATAYKKANTQVKGMLQLDMTAYVKPGTTPVIGLMPDYTDSSLTQFVGSLVDAYTNVSWTINTACGYGCSDHASWNKQGYPTALPFEGLFANINPKIHSSADTTSVAGFTWSHTLQYSKLAAAFAYELAV